MHANNPKGVTGAYNVVLWGATINWQCCQTYRYARGSWDHHVRAEYQLTVWSQNGTWILDSIDYLAIWLELLCAASLTPASDTITHLWRQTEPPLTLVIPNAMPCQRTVKYSTSYNYLENLFICLKNNTLQPYILFNTFSAMIQFMWPNIYFRDFHFKLENSSKYIFYT